MGVEYVLGVGGFDLERVEEEVRQREFFPWPCLGVACLSCVGSAQHREVDAGRGRLVYRCGACSGWERLFTVGNGSAVSA